MPAATIGFIGTGVMGSSMAAHLLAAGHPLVLHSRTKLKAEPLLARGARWADSPRAVAEDSDIVLSMVGYPLDVEAVHLGREGTLAAAKRPRLLVDLTTSTPTLAVAIARAARKVGAGAVDAP